MNARKNRFKRIRRQARKLLADPAIAAAVRDKDQSIWDNYPTLKYAAPRPKQS